MIKDITSFLESIAPLQLQENYDNAGLLTGKYEWEVKGILFSLDATVAVIEEAKALGCNLVISHHPILFSGLKRINGYHYVEEAIIQAIKNDIALYAIHTNLDNVLYQGVNGAIADKIGLQDQKILLPKNPDIPDFGAGLIGQLPHPMSYKDFTSLLKSRFGLTGLKATQDLYRPISKVALCGGSGSFLIRQAIKAGADAYVSADIKYHEFFEANGQLSIFDIGHFESEQFTIQLLYRVVTEKFTNFAAHCTKINTNPVQFL